jgi:hypothetical protein
MTPVDRADEVRTALADNFGAILQAEKVALDIEIARLHSGPHPAVTEHDTISEIVEEVCHRIV